MIVSKEVFDPLLPLEITNEEWGWCVGVIDVVQWLNKTGTPVPQTSKELGKLLARYLRHRRKERMKALRQMMKKKKRRD